MSDNSSDDRFSMPPIEGVWDGKGDNTPDEDPVEEEAPEAPRGLTLPPPGLFARLDEPSSPTTEFASFEAAPEPEPEDEAEPESEPVEDEVELFDEEAASDAFEDEAAEEAPSGLSGIADAIDIVEQLAAQADAEERVPTGDDLVFAEAAAGLHETDDVAEDPAPEPVPLPSYAAVNRFDDLDDDEPEAAPIDELVADEPAAITLPMYGDGDRRDDDEEILPHFLLEESAPLDIVAAQDQLREMAHKNREKGDAEQKPSLARTLAEIPILLIVAAVIAFLVKTFLAQAYYIPSGSMIPQLQIDDRVVVSKLAYKVHDPRRGDIVVFDDPRSGEQKTTEDSNFLRKIGEGVGVVQPSTDEFIKRVIGLPGETVSGHDGYVYINNHKLIEPYLPEGVRTDDFGEQTVAEGKLWVMGDNRSGSADSRVFGQIKIDTIVGRAVVKVWPFSHISFL